MTSPRLKAKTFVPGISVVPHSCLSSLPSILFSYPIVRRRPNSMPTSPGRPFTRRFKRASLLDLANRDSPKPMSSMKERRADRKPCQWKSDSAKKAAKNCRVSLRSSFRSTSIPKEKKARCRILHTGGDKTLRQDEVVISTATVLNRYCNRRA